MEQLLAFFKNAYTNFQELSQGKKVAVLTLAAAGLASLLVMAFWVQAPDQQLLYANLSQEDAGAIVAELKGQKIPYELNAGGTTIRVPADKVHEIRLQLATKGLPQGGEVGLEIFDKTALGMTEFVQKLNYQRALQGELTRTINTLDVVDQARVHLVIPEESLFLKDKVKGKASVMVKIKPGKTISENQIQGIVHLVSSSVKGVPPENVAIVDFNGNILTGAKGGGEEAMIAADNFKLKARLEGELEASIRQMLEDALGKGKVIAKVNAEINFEKVERTEEIFDPDSQVVRSEQRTSEATVGAVPPGGVPGVQALVPTGETAGGGPGSAAKRNNEKQTLNYEINKVVRHVSKPMGEIKKLSVSVLVDGVVDETGAYKPRTPEEMAKYLDIVKSAVGFDEQRNDNIKVENVQFDKTLLLEQQKKLALEERIELGMQVAKYLLGAIFVLLFFTRVVRPLMNWMTTSVEVVPEGPEMALESQALEEERKRLAAELGPAAQEIRKAVADFADSDPQYTASVVRKWLRERKVEER
jgi:flagellar M-ring protein FliF